MPLASNHNAKWKKYSSKSQRLPDQKPRKKNPHYSLTKKSFPFLITLLEKPQPDPDTKEEPSYPSIHTCTYVRGTGIRNKWQSRVFHANERMTDGARRTHTCTMYPYIQQMPPERRGKLPESPVPLSYNRYIPTCACRAAVMKSHACRVILYFRETTAGQSETKRKG